MRKFKKQAIALLLSISMTVTQGVVGWGNSFTTPVSVQAAEENLFQDGDLGDDETGGFWDNNNQKWFFEDKDRDSNDDTWTILGSNAISYSSYAANDTTNGLGISYNGTSGTVSMYQDVSSLAAGNYTVNGYIKETNNKNTKIKMYTGTTDSETEFTVTLDFQQFSFSFSLEENRENYRVGFLITSEQGAWVCLDSLSLVKEVSGEDQIKVAKEKLQHLVDEISALNSTDYTAESWADLQTELKSAENLLKDENTSLQSLEDVYKNLSDAKTALKDVSIVQDAGINVKK